MSPMDLKSTLVKSKSSNSAISKKSKEDTRRQYNKQSRSNSNFPCHGLKKRGVYVEKRVTKMNLHNNGKEVDCITQKPPPRPRAGQKKFLASVLSILSKSTTGTQYPELVECTEERKSRNKCRNKTCLKQANANDTDKENIPRHATDKFKSRVLNKKIVKEDKKKMVVLQSKKEIAQTPSNYSEWSNKIASQNSNLSNLIIYDDSSNRGEFNVADELKNAVLEGRNIKTKKLRYQEDEPKTLVSDGSKDQNNIYNFFVDLLETTISVYNVKAEYDAAGNSDISKTNLQINESVANKLIIDNGKYESEYEDGNISLQYPNYIENDLEFENDLGKSKTKPKFYKQGMPMKTIKARKLKADSFVYSNNAKKIPQKSKSVEMNRKTIFRNKHDLINVLKQELEEDTKCYDEPRTIFQALRIMARNKKKITFDPSINHKTFTDECVLKRRKVISSRKVKKNKQDAPKNLLRPTKASFNRNDYVENSRTAYKDIYRRSESETIDTESYHSLEVYGFDYEPKQPLNKAHFSKTRDPTFTYHSSQSHSDLDFDIDDVILNPTLTLSSFKKLSPV